MNRSAALIDESSRSTEPRTLAESVYRRLRADIVWGRHAPGAPLKSAELQALYDIGISPLREALARLISERLVQTVGQRGFWVAPLRAQDVLDTMETRIVIESAALRASIEKGDVAWESRVVAAYHALSKFDIPKQPGRVADEWASHHRSFHMALLSGCESPWQLHFVELLYDQAERYRLVRARANASRTLARKIEREHRALFEAVIARDKRAALAALDAHYRATAEEAAAAIAKDLADETSASEGVRQPDR